MKRRSPEIYEPAELQAFFSSLNSDYDKLLFDLLLTTGLREREAMHLEWADISFARSVLHVKSKPEWDHKIKDAEEREMPLTQEMIRQLREYLDKHPARRLIFGYAVAPKTSLMDIFSVDSKDWYGTLVSTVEDALPAYPVKSVSSGTFTNSERTTSRRC